MQDPKCDPLKATFGSATKNSLAFGVNGISVAHAISFHLLKRSPSSWSKRMAALRGSTAVFSRTSLLALFIASTPEDVDLPYMQLSDAIAQRAAAYCLLVAILVR